MTPVLGVQSVRTDIIDVSDVGNDRTVFDPGDLADLAATIDRDGQLTPAIVRPSPTVPGRLELVAGERRLRAIRDLLKRSEIVVDVRELDDAGAWDIMGAENLFRADLDPVDEGRMLWNRAHAYGWTVAEVAKWRRRSTGYCADRMALLALDDAVSALVRSGQITPRRGSMMAELEPAGQIQAALRGVDLGSNAFRGLVAELLEVQNQSALFDAGNYELRTELYDEAASRYIDAMANTLTGTAAEELVGPAEVAERAGVSRSAVAQWRRRYPDFPAPVAVLGAGRQAPKGMAGGMAVWTWGAVHAWLDATGRLPR